MSLEKNYRDALIASLSIHMRESITKPEGADLVVKAAVNGSQTAYDAIIHHWVSFKQDNDSIPELFHPAALVASVSDRQSAFANENVFRSAFSDLMIADNQWVIYIPTGSSYLENLGEKLAYTVPRTFFAKASETILDDRLKYSIHKGSIDEQLFFSGWNFLHPRQQEIDYGSFEQRFDPAHIGSGLRVLEQLPSTSEADASFYSLARNLLGLPSRVVVDLPLTFTEEHFEKIRQAKELQEKYFHRPMRILAICERHLAVANFMIEDNFKYSTMATNGYRFSMYLEETKDDQIILTFSGKLFLGFAIAVFTAIAQILDSSNSDKTLYPPIKIDSIDNYSNDTDCIVKFLKGERPTTDSFIKTLLNAYPVLATYRDYFLDHAHYMEEPRFAFKDDKIQMLSEN